MKILEGKQEAYQHNQNINLNRGDGASVGYASAALDFAHKWAENMEEKINEDTTSIDDFAKDCYPDEISISYGQFGGAVGVLRMFWAHNDLLETWWAKEIK